MKRNENNGMSRQILYGKHSFLSRIFNILDIDDSAKGPMIAVSLLEPRNFVYFNNAFQLFIGDKIDKVLEEGWPFWFQNICPQEVLLVKNSLKHFFSSPFDRKPITLKYHLYDGSKNVIYIRHEIILHKLESCTMAVNYFFDVSDKEKIEHCFNNDELFDKAYSSNKESGIISSREKEVLHLIGEGYSSKQIADRLYISNHTAISHRKNLIEKFKVKNTAHLIKTASRNADLW